MREMRQGIQLHPIQLVEDKDGTFKLADGEHRLLAQERLGRKLIIADVI
jgi:ParB-like chromosome segregation protein Spo0J